MANKITAPQAKKPLGERLYGDERSKKRAAETAKEAANAKGRVFPGADSMRGRVYNSDDVRDMKRDHDMILDPDGKVRKYKREKSA